MYCTYHCTSVRARDYVLRIRLNIDPYSTHTYIFIHLLVKRNRTLLTLSLSLTLGFSLNMC